MNTRLTTNLSTSIGFQQSSLSDSEYASWLGAKTCCSLLLAGGGVFLIVSGAHPSPNTPVILIGIASSILGLATCCWISGSTQNTNRICQNTSLFLGSVSLLTASCSLIVAGAHSSQLQVATLVSGACLSCFGALGAGYTLSRCFRNGDRALASPASDPFNQYATLV